MRNQVAEAHVLKDAFKNKVAEAKEVRNSNEKSKKIFAKAHVSCVKLARERDNTEERYNQILSSFSQLVLYGDKQKKKCLPTSRNCKKSFKKIGK